VEKPGHLAGSTRRVIDPDHEAMSLFGEI